MQMSAPCSRLGGTVGNDIVCWGFNATHHVGEAGSGKCTGVLNGREDWIYIAGVRNILKFVFIF